MAEGKEVLKERCDEILDGMSDNINNRPLSITGLEIVKELKQDMMEPDSKGTHTDMETSGERMKSKEETDNYFHSKKAKAIAKKTGGQYLPITFVIICHPKDQVYLPDCIASIPVGSEIVILHTALTKLDCKVDDLPEPEYVKDKVVTQDNGTVIKEYEYKFYTNTEFINSFSEARNIAIRKSSRNWIFSLDADEQVVVSATELQAIANNIKKHDKLGGFLVGNTSMSPSSKDGLAWHTAKQLRLFINDPDIRWERRCHEQVIGSLKEKGYTILDSSIGIKHMGYFKQDPVELYNKHLRNAYMMLRDLGEMKEYDELFSENGKGLMAQLHGSLGVLKDNNILPKQEVMK